MEDAAEVVALREGDLAAFGRIYDTYADRLHAYATTLLGDRDSASDAVHDAFLLAHDRIGQLRDPALLRPWLYAITRHQAQRILRTRGRTTGLEAAAEMSDEEVRWDRSLDADDARLLVLAALAGLNDGDREVIELSLRHDLDNAALSRVLGHSSSHTSARVSRAKQQFDLALTAVLLMRTRGRHCDELHALIGDESTLTPLLRKRIARHVKSCPSCASNRRAALAVLPGVALAVPFAGAPEPLRAALISDAGALHAEALPLVNHGNPLRFDNDGFPRIDDGMRKRSAVAGTVAAVLALILAGTIGTGVIAGRDRSTSDVARVTPIAATTTPAPKPTARTQRTASVRPTSAPTTPPPSARPSTAAPTSGVAEGSGNASAALPAPSPKAPTLRPHRAPTSTPLSAPAAVPSIAVTWADGDLSACSGAFDVRVYATVSGASIRSVTASWTAASGSGSVSLTRTGGQSWQGLLAGIPAGAPARLTVRVTTAQGVTASSIPESLTNVCGE